MTKYMAFLLFIFMAGKGYATTSCEEDYGKEQNGGQEKTLWDSLFKSFSLGGSKCKPSDMSVNKPGQEVPIQSNIESIKSLIKVELEEGLEKYNDEAGVKFSNFEQDMNRFNRQLSGLERTIEIHEIKQIDNSKIIEATDKKLRSLVEEIDQRLRESLVRIEQSEKELASRVERNKEEASDGLAALDRLVSDNILYLVVSTSLFLLMLFTLTFFLRKKMFDQGNDITNDLIDIRESLEDEFVKVDTKLVEFFEIKMTDIGSSPSANDTVVDHSLVIKIADELVRIQKNIERMDEKTKGIKQLSASVSRIRDNVAANGYEIVQMMGLPYSEGMRASVDFVIDENLESGKQIITRVIKPQINFQGVMIQSAQLEVSQGE